MKPGTYPFTCTKKSNLFLNLLQRLVYPGGCLLIIIKATLSFYAKVTPYRWVMMHYRYYLHPVIPPDISVFIVRPSISLLAAMYYSAKASVVLICLVAILIH